MADQPFVAEISMFAYSSRQLVPKGWATCDGQLLPVAQNTALFALLGTNYGGNGTSNFALPNLTDRVVLHADDNNYFIGQVGGSATVTLLQSEIPFHNHNLMGRTDTGEDRTPGDEAFAKSTGGFLYGPAGNTVQLAPEAVAPAGGDQPHNNMMPYATVNYCIALQGVFPPRQ